MYFLPFYIVFSKQHLERWQVKCTSPVHLKLLLWLLLANVILPTKNMSLFQGVHKQMVCTCEGFCILWSFLAFLVRRAQLPPCTCSVLFHLSYSEVTPVYSLAAPHPQSHWRAPWTASSVFTGLCSPASLLEDEGFRHVSTPALSRWQAGRGLIWVLPGL